MEKDLELNYLVIAGDPEKNEVLPITQQHLSLSKLRSHLNQQTSKKEQQLANEHILHCDRCRAIWDSLVHFENRNRNGGKSTIAVIRAQWVKFLAINNPTQVGLKSLLFVTVIVMGLLIATYDFGEGHSAGLGKIPAYELPQNPQESRFEPAAPSNTPEAPSINHSDQQLLMASAISLPENILLTTKENMKDIEIKPEFSAETVVASKPQDQTNAVVYKPDENKPKAFSSEAKSSKNKRKKVDSVLSQKKFRTISGIVIDQETGSPLDRVKVSIPGLYVSTFSDPSGAFQINVPLKRTKLAFNYRSTQIFQAVDSSSHLMNVSIPRDELLKKKEAVKMSAFPVTGETYYKTYIKHNLRYPARALRNGISGNVIVAFTVAVDGSLSNLRVSQSLGYGCDKEAIRLVEEGPDWQPALVNGEPVSKEAILLVNFTPQHTSH